MHTLHSLLSESSTIQSTTPLLKTQEKNHLNCFSSIQNRTSTGLLNTQILKSAQHIKQPSSTKLLTFTSAQVIAKALTTSRLSKQEIQTAIPKMQRCIRESPLHVGFVCNDRFFNAEGKFWPSAQIHSRQSLSTLSGSRAKQTSAKAPVYGALNFTMRGHTGWGASSFVLKPNILKNAVINSRDTGEPNGIGEFACTGSEENLMPILWDWAQMHMFDEIAQAWHDNDRKTLIPQASKPLEVAIETSAGSINHDQVALVVVAENEIKSPEGILAVQKRCAELALPLILHKHPEGQIPFLHYDAYQKVIVSYRARQELIDQQA